jgi:hypothetical protein
MRLAAALRLVLRGFTRRAKRRTTGHTHDILLETLALVQQRYGARSNVIDFYETPTLPSRPLPSIKNKAAQILPHRPHGSVCGVL